MDHGPFSHTSSLNFYNHDCIIIVFDVSYASRGTWIGEYTTIHSVFYLVFREIKNKHTGIDITIPRFTQEKGLLQSTYEYQVVVVSNLPYFKSPKHKESDTVQFMVNEVKLEIIKIFQSFSFWNLWINFNFFRFYILDIVHDLCKFISEPW